MAAATRSGANSAEVRSPSGREVLGDGAGHRLAHGVARWPQGAHGASPAGAAATTASAPVQHQPGPEALLGGGVVGAGVGPPALGPQGGRQQQGPGHLDQVGQLGHRGPASRLGPGRQHGQGAVDVGQRWRRWPPATPRRATPRRRRSWPAAGASRAPGSSPGGGAVTRPGGERLGERRSGPPPVGGQAADVALGVGVGTPAQHGPHGPGGRRAATGPARWPRPPGRRRPCPRAASWRPAGWRRAPRSRPPRRRPTGPSQ